MKWIILIMISCWSSFGNSQTIQNVLDNLSYTEIKSLNDFYALKSIIGNSGSKEFIGIKDSVYNEKVVFDSLNQLFLFLNYTTEEKIVAINVFDFSGNPFFYWEIESVEFKGHRITFYKTRKKKTIYIGCQKGKKCKFHGFSKKLFTGDTMSKSISEFNQMLSEITRKY